MEEKIKNITSEVYEELIKLFGAKIERIILYGSYARRILIWNQTLIS